MDSALQGKNDKRYIISNVAQKSKTSALSPLPANARQMPEAGKVNLTAPCHESQKNFPHIMPYKISLPDAFKGYWKVLLWTEAVI